MNKEIDNYMTVQEAAYRWGKSVDTVKNHLKPSIVGETQLDTWTKAGLIKPFTPPGKTNKLWILSKAFMNIRFGEEKR